MSGSLAPSRSPYILVGPPIMLWRPHALLSACLPHVTSAVRHSSKQAWRVYNAALNEALQFSSVECFLSLSVPRAALC